MRSPLELVFGFSPEGRRREEAFYLSLDGNAEIEELLERDRMAEEQELLERDRLTDSVSPICAASGTWSRSALTL